LRAHLSLLLRRELLLLPQLVLRRRRLRLRRGRRAKVLVMQRAGAVESARGVELEELVEEVERKRVGFRVERGPGDAVESGEGAQLDLGLWERLSQSST
jgi:hypothetical protein